MLAPRAAPHVSSDRALLTVSPRTALARKLERLTGRYTSDGGFHTVTVTREGPELHVAHKTPLGGQKFRFRPWSVDASTSTFVTLEADGSETTAEFFSDTDDVDLLIDRVLVTRGDNATGDGTQAG